MNLTKNIASSEPSDLEYFLNLLQYITWSNLNLNEPYNLSNVDATAIQKKMLPSKEIVLILLCPPQISWLSYVNSLPSSLNTKKSLEIKIWIIPVGAMLFSVMRIRNSWGYGVETHLYLSNTDMTTPSPHNQILVSLWLIVRSFWCCEENHPEQEIFLTFRFNV